MYSNIGYDSFVDFKGGILVGSRKSLAAPCPFVISHKVGTHRRIVEALLTPRSTGKKTMFPSPAREINIKALPKNHARSSRSHESSLACPKQKRKTNPSPASPAFILDKSLAEAEGPFCRVFLQLGFVWVKAHTEQ